MPQVKLHVSAFYNGETIPKDSILTCDVEFAERVVQRGHGISIVDGEEVPTPVVYTPAPEQRKKSWRDFLTRTKQKVN